MANSNRLITGARDVMVLQTLAARRPLHGYGIARRIEQANGDVVLFLSG